MFQDNWEKLISPSLEEKSGSNPNQMTLEIGPLERGFGLTIGNALRRVLLSSIRGSAIIGVEIDNVVQEFSPIPGVREDVIDILLNLKGVVVKSDDRKPRKLLLKSSQPGEVTAGMINQVTGVEILNPRHVICHLDRDASIQMEITVGVGKGYVPAELNKPADAAINFIPIDAIFSPVKSVSYKVQPAREGKILDYDKLILNVETDGSITPKDAIAYASRIVQEYFQIFINFDEPVKSKQEDETPEAEVDSNLYLKVTQLELSVRSANCLKNDNIIYVGDLVQKSEQEMLKTPNFGRKSLNEIKEVLSGMNLSLGMEIVDWPPENIEILSKEMEEKDISFP
ncbi:MAG: DNA-directed RNA polymerase subunit alpha [Paracoccaceae bacterium]|nr:DNA-directed RNA polymerase subunit alpha [Paracoccaceae bacterium]MDE2675027.1 DNA-directed RNA polymerase subunit alpha [Paracoccaceae bacterium]